MSEIGKNKFASVEEALEAFKAGELIVVTDDPERENEGDLICAARWATPENVNFMAVNGKGLICMVKMVENKPPLANLDYTHINYRGGKMIAKKLFNALMEGK